MLAFAFDNVLKIGLAIELEKLSVYGSTVEPMVELGRIDDVINTIYIFIKI